MAARSTTVHASAVLVGARAVLIRGPSGSGKSHLAFELIQSARAGLIRFARFVGDDRVHLEVAGGRLLVSPAVALAGLIEVRGVGLQRIAYEPSAVVGLVIDLGAAETERLPPADQRQTTIVGIIVPRLLVASGVAALPMALAMLTTSGCASECERM